MIILNVQKNAILIRAFQPNTFARVYCFIRATCLALADSWQLKKGHTFNPSILFWKFGLIAGIYSYAEDSPGCSGKPEEICTNAGPMFNADICNMLSPCTERLCSERRDANAGICTNDAAA